LEGIFIDEDLVELILTMVTFRIKIDDHGFTM